MSARVTVATPGRPAARTEGWALFALLAVGLLIRLLFVSNAGFKNDISSFEGWAGTLAQVPLNQFYAKAGFIDYPPGYFYVLWIVGHLYAPFAHLDQPGEWSIFRLFVKLPAILVDLVDGWLLYVVVRRFTPARWALAAAACFVLNPAIIYISAAWGQVDSIAGGLVLGGIYLLLRSGDRDDRGATLCIVLAWLLLAYSVLVKPQGAILGLLFIAFAFAQPQRRAVHLRALLLGIAAAFALAWALSLPFHPVANPLAVFAWLLERYRVGAGIYDYNSVNAFNLWTIRYPFWQHDNTPVLFWPQWLWGMILLGAASALVLLRYLQVRTERALLESAALLTLAFFVLSTRMHERYVFDALLFCIAAMFVGRRYVAAAAVLTVTLFTNLMYSLQYMHVVEARVAGVNAADMWPLLTRGMSLANVLVLGVLAYVFLGGAETAEEDVAGRPVPVPVDDTVQAPRSRSWFDPREGLARMVWPLDHAIAAGLGVVSFVLSYIGYARVTEKIFDEIYFARAGEEYLKRWYIYESTHPPLTKLLITASMALFGGLAHGDNAAGWRFLDLVAGALTVSLLFVFAKRITRSTLFAAIAASLLLFDGMHFVQSRIATPEAFVGLFSLATIYTFYRYWIAAQVRTAAEMDTSQIAVRIIGAGVCLLVAVGGVLLRFAHEADGPFTNTAKLVAIVYAFAGLYLLFRAVIMPRFFAGATRFTSYPEGATVRAGARSTVLVSPDGGVVDSAQKAALAGDLSRPERGALVLRDGELTATYRRDGTLEYATPLGSATYSPGGITVDGEHGGAGNPRLWLALFAVSITCLVTSKWYGVMTYPATLGIVAWVWLQPKLSAVLREFFGRPRRPASWGNPYGFPLDVVFATLIFIGGTIYFAAYTPQFVGLSDTPQSAPRAYTLSDVIGMQKSMYDYHSTLKADHPYKSVWWQWPLDLRPIAYYWKDTRPAPLQNAENACCVSEITSLPNPLILWFGLFTVPFVGVLAYREKNKGYLLLVVAYLLQWLPWIRSPRISFAYHFYVDIAIICLCNAIVLQRLWTWGDDHPDRTVFARLGALGYVAAVGLAFAFFYPLLAGVPVPWHDWNIRTLPWLMNSHWASWV